MPTQNSDSDKLATQLARDFSCRQCGNCCRPGSGWVFLSPAESAAMAARLGLLPFEFQRKYLSRVPGGLLLSAPDHNPRCVAATRSGRSCSRAKRL